MKAVVIEAYKEPWKIEERPDPKPAPGQVLIKVEASGMCGTDVHVHNGDMPFIPTPIIGGHEPVGKIVELGPGVPRFEVGDRVAGKSLSEKRTTLAPMRGNPERQHQLIGQVYPDWDVRIQEGTRLAPHFGRNTFSFHSPFPKA